MRLAIVAASSYEENGQVEQIPNAELDVELFGGRLAEPDAGFQVHAFPAQRGLAEGIELLLADVGERPAALVFYFWGYALLSQERGATLLLDGPKLSTFTLARLRRVLSEAADVSLLILDATLAEGSHGEPLDAVRAMGMALSGGDSNISSLIAVRSPGQSVVQGPPPFTGLLQMILDAQTGSASALTPATLFRAMQAEEVLFADIPAAGCYLGRTDFELVPSARPLSAAPPPPAPATTDYDDTDEVTAQRAPAPLPSRFPPPPPPPIPARPAPRASVLPPAAPASSAAEHLRRVLADCDRAGDHDGAYRAAACLEALGEADINESLLVTTHRPDGLQAVRSALSYADWHERLCVGCEEPLTDALLRALGPAIARVGFQHARRLRRQTPLPEDARQDPAKSTTTLAKSLYWTSRLLSAPTGELYVLPDSPALVLLEPGPDGPLLTCGRALGSGFGLPELICVWARELAFTRAEQVALTYFPDAAELTQLLSAALAVGGAASMRAIDADAKRIASGLKREVRGAALDALGAAARGFPAHEVSARAMAFIRAAELVANRVALVACGNLEITLALGERFPRRSLIGRDQQRADLLRFAVSAELGLIRAELGVAVA